MLLVPEIAVGSDGVLFSQHDAFTLARDFAARGAAVVQLRDVSHGDAQLSRDLPLLTGLSGSLPVPLRFAGGISDTRAMERLLRSGISTVVADAVLVAEPALVRWALDMLGDRLMVELQAIGPELFPEVGHALTVTEAALRLQYQGVGRVLYRDVGGDDLLPLAQLRELCESTRLEVAFGARITSLDQLRSIAQMQLSSLESVVVGESLLDGTLTLEAAAAALGGSLGR